MVTPLLRNPALALRPTKLTLAQKAKVLALLGWDAEVLPTESTSHIQSLQHSASYSLQHLLGRSGGGGGGSSSSAAGPRSAAPSPTSMMSVVLSCPTCRSRVGLWNFAGMKPVLVGRFTASTNEAGPLAMVPLHSYSRAAQAAGGGGFGGTPGMSESLSRTIAGGSYSYIPTQQPHGGGHVGGGVGFGAGCGAVPVFGLEALNLKTAQLEAHRVVGGGGGGGSGAASRLVTGKRLAECMEEDEEEGAECECSRRGGGRGGGEGWWWWSCCCCWWWWWYCFCVVAAHHPPSYWVNLSVH